MIRNAIVIAAVAAVTSAALVTAQPTTVSFQQGIHGYNGTFDKRIGAPTTANPAGINQLGTNLSEYFLDGEPDIRGLLRFNGILGAGPGQIPLGANVISAKLTLTTSNQSPDARTGGSFAPARLLRDWDATTLYSAFGTGTTSIGPGWYAGVNPTATRGVYGFSDPLDSVINNDQAATSEVAPLVQAWANGEPNYGFTIQPGTGDGWQVYTSGTPIAEFRPKLEVTYDFSTYQTARIKQGLNGYNGTTMAWLGENNTTTDGTTLNQLFIDGSAAPGANPSPDDQLLIKFDNLFASQGGSIPDGATIEDAFMVITTGNTSANAASDGFWDAHQMLVPWDFTSTYSGFNGDGPTEADAEIAAAVDSPAASAYDSQVYFNITDTLEAWQNGAANHGLSVQARNNPDGWQIHWLGTSDATALPELIVRYRISENRWAFDQDGDWNIATNWTSSVSPNATGAVAILGNVITQNRTVTLNAPTTIDKLVIDNDADGSYTVAGTSTLTFGGESEVALQVLSGSHTISAPVALTKPSTVDIANASQLSLSGSVSGAAQGITKTGAGTLVTAGFDLGTLSINEGVVRNTSNAAVTRTLSIAADARFDLAGGVLIEDYANTDPSPLSELVAAVLNGRLTSSTLTGSQTIGIAEISDLGLPTFGGYAFTDASAVVARVTLSGDSNLDGLVGFADLLNLARNYNGTGTTWFSGDFNYDGSTNFSDLLALARNYNLSNAGIGADISQFDSSFTADFALALSMVAVPEPTTLGFLGTTALVTLARRRR